jgi:hypothetical protein
MSYFSGNIEIVTVYGGNNSTAKRVLKAERRLAVNLFKISILQRMLNYFRRAIC